MLSSLPALHPALSQPVTCIPKSIRPLSPPLNRLLSLQTDSFMRAGSASGDSVSETLTSRLKG